ATHALYSLSLHDALPILTAVRAAVKAFLMEFTTPMIVANDAAAVTTPRMRGAQGSSAFFTATIQSMMAGILSAMPINTFSNCSPKFFTIVRLSWRQLFFN